MAELVVNFRNRHWQDRQETQPNQNCANNNAEDSQGFAFREIRKSALNPRKEEIAAKGRKPSQQESRHQNARKKIAMLNQHRAKRTIGRHDPGPAFRRLYSTMSLEQMPIEREVLEGNS